MPLAIGSADIRQVREGFEDFDALCILRDWVHTGNHGLKIQMALNILLVTPFMKS
jgi:hypothetical protein